MLMYLKIAGLLGLMYLGYWFNNTLRENRDLKEQNEVMVLQIKKNEDNVKLLVQQLDREIEYRQIAESAVNDLNNEVPDVVYSQSLPPEIQGVLDRFNARIRK